VGQEPPVNAFWSVTMYDGKTQLLIENPIDRYLMQFGDASKSERKRRQLSPTVGAVGRERAITAERNHSVAHALNIDVDSGSGDRIRPV
jgi:hypothetical protein